MIVEILKRSSKREDKPVSLFEKNSAGFLCFSDFIAKEIWGGMGKSRREIGVIEKALMFVAVGGNGWGEIEQSGEGAGMKNGAERLI